MKTTVENRYIWLNGEVLRVNDVKVNILTPTAQFGLNVFEGIPCYWNEEKEELYAFRADDHYKRLINSARLLEIDCPYEIKDMKEALIEIVKANDYREDIMARQTLFVGGLGSWGSDGPAGMFVAPIPRKHIGKEYKKNGLKACVSSWRRICEDDLSPRIKCGANYINSRLGQREALRNGYDTCIFLNKEGKVAEGPGCCVFIIKNGALITPLLTDSVLASITRDTVLRIAGENGIAVMERSIDRTELYEADEVFLCGSSMEIKQIESIDGHRFGRGDVTARIRELYRARVTGKAPVDGWICRL